MDLLPLMRYRLPIARMCDGWVLLQLHNVLLPQPLQLYGKGASIS